jgi:hypothetical protein
MLKFVHTFCNIIFGRNKSLEHEMKLIPFNNSLSTSKERECVVIAKINQLLLFSEKKLLLQKSYTYLLTYSMKQSPS